MAIPAQMLGLEAIGGTLVPNHALPTPAAAAGELLIRTAYIGLNRADLLQVAGKYPPPEGASPLPGLEISGHVAAIGAGVTGYEPGDAVCALLTGGGYAEYVTVPAAQALKLPPGYPLAEAACLPEAAATSIMALVMEAGLKPGERVFIHGGASGLGILLTQIARALGAEAYATVGSAEKVALLTTLGITAIDHRAAPFAPQLLDATGGEGVDIIVDTLGGPHVSEHFSLLRRGGRMVSLAVMDGHRLDGQSMLRLLTHHLRWSGATLRSRSTAEKADIMAYVRTHVWPAVGRGAIRPVIDSRFPLLSAEKALARMQERLHLGKILLEVAPN